MYLSKDDIFKADDLPVEDVHVDAWGGTVRVRGLTATERDRFEIAIDLARRSDLGSVEVRAQVVGRCIVDEDGKRLFTDKELSKLGHKSGAALNELFDVVRRLSGMDDKASERAAEDFGDAPADGSSSG